MKLPLFNNKKIVYKSLKEFSFNSFECENDITLEMLNNLNINIDNAPILENFTIRCISKSIDKKTYFNFIKKVLRLKLKVIYKFIYIEEIKNNPYKGIIYLLKQQMMQQQMVHMRQMQMNNILNYLYFVV